MQPYFSLIRPKQWIKNLLVLAPLFFAGRLSDMASWHAAIQAALAFIGLASVVYIFNDINDMAEDRLHPVKSARPLAQNSITILHASLLAVFFALISFFLLAHLPYGCLMVAVSYLALNIVYTRHLKHVAIADILCIGAFYVMRVLMGCFALAVVASPWIILTTFFLAMFLGFAKRAHEISLVDYASRKKNLAGYGEELLKHLMLITGAGALITYAIYSAEMAIATGKQALTYTIIFVCFGLFRYMQSVYIKGQGGEPENMLLKDKWQIANLLAWFVAIVGILY